MDVSKVLVVCFFLRMASKFKSPSYNSFFLLIVFYMAINFRGDLSKWDVSSVTSVNNIFFSATKTRQTNDQWQYGFGVSQILCWDILNTQGAQWRGTWDAGAGRWPQQYYSSAKYGCCPAGKYMSTAFTPLPALNTEPSTFTQSTFNAYTQASFDQANYCSVCPAGQHKSARTNVPNDETSCQLCESGKCSAPDSESCSRTCDSLPDGMYAKGTVLYSTIAEEGKWGYEDSDRRIGFFGGVIDDITGSDPTKKSNAIEKYGPISSWNVSRITDMSFGFYGKTTFNADLTLWNTSNVLNMNYLFTDCNAFNGDISTFDTAKVTSMSQMFSGNYVFNGDVSNFNTEKVTDMENMFSMAKAFNGDLSQFDITKVTLMNGSKSLF